MNSLECIISDVEIIEVLHKYEGRSENTYKDAVKQVCVNRLIRNLVGLNIDPFVIKCHCHFKTIIFAAFMLVAFFVAKTFNFQSFQRIQQVCIFNIILQLITKFYDEHVGFAPNKSIAALIKFSTLALNNFNFKINTWEVLI